MAAATPTYASQWTTWDAEGTTTNDYVARLLGLPAGYVLEATLSLGVPAEHRAPASLTDALRAKVHNERF